MLFLKLILTYSCCYQKNKTLYTTSYIHIELYGVISGIQKGIAYVQEHQLLWPQVSFTIGDWRRFGQQTEKRQDAAQKTSAEQ